MPGSFDLYKLHQVIQIVMGWTDSHLHHFLADGTYYSFPHPDSDWDDAGEEDSQQVTLAQIAVHEKRKLTYVYDFGDSWEHEIMVEKILPPEIETKYPQCIAGKRACPPEDIGGIWGYYDFLEALNDPNHNEHILTLSGGVAILIQKSLMLEKSTRFFRKSGNVSCFIVKSQPTKRTQKQLCFLREK